MKPKIEGICDNCNSHLIQRDDDKPVNVKKRLDLYKEKTMPLINFYKEKGLLVEIIINKNIEEIRDNLIDKVNLLLDGKASVIGEIK